MYSTIAVTPTTTTRQKKHNNLRLNVETYSAHYSPKRVCSVCVFITTVSSIFIAGDMYIRKLNSFFPHFFQFKEKIRRRRKRRKKTRCVVNYVISISIVFFFAVSVRFIFSCSIVLFIPIEEQYTKDSEIISIIEMSPSPKHTDHLILDFIISRSNIV